MFVNKELRVPVELGWLAEAFQSMLAQKIVMPNLETDLNKLHTGSNNCTCNNLTF